MTNQYTMFHSKHINFALGTPSTIDMPVEIINNELNNLKITNELLQYGYTSGFRDVRCAISNLMKQYTLKDICPDSIFMTTGISQSLFMLCKLLTKEGNCIFVDELTYFVAINMFKEFNLNIKCVTSETFETLLQENTPVFYYNVPYYNNPNGVSKTIEEMNNILRLSSKYNFYVINDNIYEFLGFDNYISLPLSDKCININSCSKMIAPSLKVGWIIANDEIIQKLNNCCLIQSGGALNPINYYLLQQLIITHKFDNIVNHWKSILNNRKKAMIDILKQYALKYDFIFTEPNGGYFVWIIFKTDFISNSYFNEKQLFHNGSSFSLTNKYNNCVRLCYAFYNENDIQQGLLDLFNRIDTYKQIQIDNILSVIPVVPFKGIERFYDINGLLNNIQQLKIATNMIIEHCKYLSFDMIGCIDARGFLFGPLIGIALNKPIFMIRKNGKMPNSIISETYTKEYKSDTDNEQLSITKDLVNDKKILIIDDLAATGGTLIAASKLINSCGGEVVECACIIELSILNARRKLQEKNLKLWSIITV
jgi:2-aminoadipate transaminase